MEIDPKVFEKILASLPGMFYWKNREGVYVFCNDNQLKALDFTSREQFIGKTVYELLPFDLAEPHHQLDERVMSQNQCIVQEEIGVTSGGVQAIYHSEKIPLTDEHGNVVGMIGVSIDVSKQKELEKELRKAKETLEKINTLKSEFIEQRLYLDEIVALLPGNVYWKNREGVYFSCNDNQVKAIGLNSREQVKGKTTYELVPFELADPIHKLDQQVMEQNQRITLEEKSMSEGGKVSTFLSDKIPLTNDKGDVIGLIGISIDISKQKEYEQALKEAKEKAEALSRIKLEFIRNMEHDIRTPFIGIYGLSEILYKQESDPIKKEYLQDIYKSAKQLMDFCNSILDYSRNEGGIVPIMQKKFNLRELIEGLIAMEKPTAIMKNLDFILEYDENIPETLLSDPYRIQRILINLVSNAIKFTTEGYIKLTIAMVKQNNQDVVLKLIIEDTGIGIPEEKLNYIYEKFSRITPANRNLYQGLGLGLPLIKQFIHELEGELDAESQLNKGTKFICAIPMKVSLLGE